MEPEPSSYDAFFRDTVYQGGDVTTLPVIFTVYYTITMYSYGSLLSIPTKISTNIQRMTSQWRHKARSNLKIVDFQWTSWNIAQSKMAQKYFKYRNFTEFLLTKKKI